VRSKGSLDFGEYTARPRFPGVVEWRPAAMTRKEEPIPALSAGLSHVVLTGLFLAAALPAQPFHLPDPGISEQQPAPRAAASPTAPAPSARLAPGVPATAPPAVVAEADPSAADPPVEAWPDDDVVRGKEQCMHLLSSVAAEIEWLEPIKKGACGLPAPVLLKNVGGGESKVVFDPPVQVNCRMVAQLGKWVKASVQSKAEKRFKSRVVRIVGASGYSCRNIYNRPNARLSQHALANAIDIGGFRLADGRTVGVLNGWGLTQRDIVARAKAKAKAEADAKAKAAKGGAKDKRDTDRSAKQVDESQGKAALLDQAGNNLTRASLSPSLLAKRSAFGGAGGMQGGEPGKPTQEALFLRDILGGACREFGTVLGPEANDPHRNHFHLDLIPRRGSGYCE
jgi:hypothetical protein